MKDFKDFTRERSDKEVIRRLAAYIKPHKKMFIIVLFMMAFSLLVQLIPPLLIGTVIDSITDETRTLAEKESRLLMLSLIFLFLIISANVVVFFQNYYLQRIGQRIVKTMRREVYDHITDLAIGQINQVPVGKLVTRVTNDTNTISEMYTNVAVNLIRNFLFLIGILIMLFILNWRLTLYVILTIPLVIIASVIFRKFSRASYRRVRANVSEVNAFLSENLSGMKVTQIFNQEDKKRREFRDRNTNLRNSYLREILVFGIYRPTIYGISMLGVIIVLFFGVMDVIDPMVAFSAGMLFSYYMYIGDFFQPIQQMAEQFNMLQNAFASAEKIFDVLDTAPLITDESDAIDLQSFSGSIEFKDVWFRYVEDEWVLKGISFKVNPGDTVAFVGATGSGKTTILSLIVRNYDIQKGQILIDGIDIRRIKRASLRQHIGQMLQDVFLFSGTIADNIRLFANELALEDVKAPSEYVGANTFIDRLPDQYDHVVLERGNNFS
ncbi:MAG: ABC transporter ATP-binding protein/permease, partial [Acholeplasmataceae bacterium]|nr:ABC transporter ATP-binding protein/permease [Acholeplasmataceae bacterium]